MNCPICNNKIIDKYSLYDDRYGYPSIFKLKWCITCEHIFLEQNFIEKDFIELYSKYYPRAFFDIDIDKS